MLLTFDPTDVCHILVVMSICSRFLTLQAARARVCIQTIEQNEQKREKNRRVKSSQLVKGLNECAA